MLLVYLFFNCRFLINLILKYHNCCGTENVIFLEKSLLLLKHFKRIKNFPKIRSLVQCKKITVSALNI